MKALQRFMLVKNRRSKPMNITFAAMIFVGLALTTAADTWSQGYREQREAYGERFGSVPQAQRAPQRHRPVDRADDLQRLRHWNEIALDANALDHTPVSP